MHFLAPVILDYVVNGREFNRRGNRSSRAALHGVYPCSGEDRWCAIAVFTDEEWQSFCQVTGNPDWTSDTRFATLQERIRNADQLDNLVGAWTISQSPEEVMALMQTAEVPAGVVKTGEDLARDPQLMHYNAFPIVDHPEMGSCAAQRASIKLTKTVPCKPTHPPLLGEHTEYVCTQLLGIPDEEFVDLLKGGVFE